MVVFTLVITSLTSTYAILYSDRIYRRLNPLLKRLGVRDLDSGAEARPVIEKPIVFLGFSHDASSLLHEILNSDPQFSDQIGVIDFNPEVKHELDLRGIQCVYGDISHADTLHHAGIEHARVLVSTIPDPILKGTNNLRLLRQARSLARDANVIVTAQRMPHARDLYLCGAAFVYVPRLMSVRELKDIVLSALTSDLASHRAAAISELQSRSEVLP